MSVQKWELKAQILELLRTDEEFRYAVAGLLGLEEILKAIRSLQEQTAESTRAIRALQEQVAEHSKAIRSLQEQVAELRQDFNRLAEQVAENTRAIRALQEQVADNTRAIRALQEQVAENTRAIRSLQEVIEGHSREIASLSRSIQALGARWGILAERAFREGMIGVVERHFGGRVRRWTCHDEEGLVFGRPSMVEADLLITDREHLLIEVKSGVFRADVFKLWRIGQLYEGRTGVRPRLIVVSPFVEEEAREAARELGIEVYSGFEL